MPPFPVVRSFAHDGLIPVAARPDLILAHMELSCSQRQGGVESLTGITSKLLSILFEAVSGL